MIQEDKYFFTELDGNRYKCIVTHDLDIGSIRIWLHVSLLVKVKNFWGREVEKEQWEHMSFVGDTWEIREHKAYNGETHKHWFSSEFIKQAVKDNLSIRDSKLERERKNKEEFSTIAHDSNI